MWCLLTLQVKVTPKSDHHSVTDSVEHMAVLVCHHNLHLLSLYKFVMDYKALSVLILNHIHFFFDLQDSMAMTGGTAAALPMSNHTRERVTVAKLTLENFYSTLLTQHEEREMR